MGWLFDLTPHRGPVFVVLRGDSVTALDALALHLVDAGSVASPHDAAELLTDALAQPVAVVW